MSHESLNLDPAISSAMSDLGISESSIDSSEEAAATESTDTEVNAEEVEASTELEGEEAQGKDAETSDNQATEEEESKEAPVEEPKLTLKEFQELEAKRLEVEGKEKALTEERTKMEMEFKEKYEAKAKDFDEMDAFLATLADKDPDLFGLIQAEFAVHQKEYAANNKFMTEVESLRQELNAYKAKASDEVVLTKLDKEMDSLKSTLGKEAEDLKIKVDYKSIEDLWAKGISPKEAFMAKHGEALMTARLSKSKLETTEKKMKGQPVVKTSGSLNKSNTPAAEPKFKDAGDWVNHFAKKLGVSA